MSIASQSSSTSRAAARSVAGSLAQNWANKGLQEAGGDIVGQAWHLLPAGICDCSLHMVVQ